LTEAEAGDEIVKRIRGRTLSAGSPATATPTPPLTTEPPPPSAGGGAQPLGEGVEWKQWGRGGAARGGADGGSGGSGGSGGGGGGAAAGAGAGSSQRGLRGVPLHLQSFEGGDQRSSGALSFASLDLEQPPPVELELQPFASSVLGGGGGGGEPQYLAAPKWWSSVSSSRAAAAVVMLACGWLVLMWRVSALQCTACCQSHIRSSPIILLPRPPPPAQVDVITTENGKLRRMTDDEKAESHGSHILLAKARGGRAARVACCALPA